MPTGDEGPEVEAPPGSSGHAMSNRGFSLIESVFALAVTDTALVWLVSASRYAVEATAVSSARTRAVTLAASLAEEMQRGVLRASSGEGAFEGMPAFRWKADVASVQANAAPVRCRDVTLSVFYLGVGGAEESIELRFLVAGN